MSEKVGLREKAAQELKELFFLTVYLALLFCGLAVYSMLLANSYQHLLFAVATALINALVIAKVILIGQAVRAGTKFESGAALYSALWKAAVFAGLVFGFHVLEEAVKGFVHGEDAAGVLHDIHITELAIRSVLIFIAFIPLFVFLELRRVIGTSGLSTLLFTSVPTKVEARDGGTPEK